MTTLKGTAAKVRRAPFTSANNAVGYPVALAAKVADRELAGKRKGRAVATAKRASRRHEGWRLDYGNGPRGKTFTSYRDAARFAASERAILRNPRIKVVKVK